MFFGGFPHIYRIKVDERFCGITRRIYQYKTLQRERERGGGNSIHIIRILYPFFHFHFFPCNFTVLHVPLDLIPVYFLHFNRVRPTFFSFFNVYTISSYLIYLLSYIILHRIYVQLLALTIFKAEYKFNLKTSISKDIIIPLNKDYYKLNDSILQTASDLIYNSQLHSLWWIF